MIIKIFEENQTFNDDPKVVIAFPMGEDDAPANSFFRDKKFSKSRIIQSLVKAIWVILRCHY